MRLQLQFDLHLPTGVYTADALSRAPKPNEYEDQVTPVSEEQVNTTQEDQTLQMLKNHLGRCWLEHERQYPVLVRP